MLFLAVAPPLAVRILSRLELAEWYEPNPHFQDDYRIAWITVLRADRGEAIPHVSATFTVLGLHPEKVWPAIVARRLAQLGSLDLYEKFYGPLELETVPKKPSRSVRIVPQRADRAA
jgi:hypothetical protein